MCSRAKPLAKTMAPRSIFYQLKPKIPCCVFTLFILEKSMFLVPQVSKKYRLGPSIFFGIHLVPQVSKPDKLGPKPDFEHVDRV